MRRAAVLALLLLAAPAAPAQTPEIVKAVEDKLGTIRYVLKLEDPAGGFAPAVGGKPGLRATSACVRALKYHGHKLPATDKHAAFVMACFDPATGGSADAPGGKADVPLTSVGVMAAAELGVPKERFRKALDYLKDHAKSFEEIRIAAGAVEAWGVKECPFPVAPWVEAGSKELFDEYRQPGPPDDRARRMASAVALLTRLGDNFHDPQRVFFKHVEEGRRPDGGWGCGGAKGSDLEATYRVMRAYVLMRYRPTDRAALRAFVASCRNADGGYGVKPGDPSGAGPTYYAAIVLHWLAEREK